MLSKVPLEASGYTDAAELPVSVVIPLFNEQLILMPNAEATGDRIDTHHAQ
jgi:hypothetical protein